MTRRTGSDTRVVVAYPNRAGPVDGIRDYATLIVEQLHDSGTNVEFIRPRSGRFLVGEFARAFPLRREAALVVQYNPFSWGRFGFAPGLLLAVALVRFRRPSVRILLTIHEAYVPIRDFRSLFMGTWQRGQLWVLLALAHGVTVTTEWLAAQVEHMRPRSLIRHLPVGSNLPDRRGSRQSERRAAGYEGRFVIATLTSGHESHLHDYVFHAAEAVASICPQPVWLVLLGAHNVAPPPGLAVDRCLAPGYLTAERLSSALAASDLFLAPFFDGATTRRGSLMAAIQHEIATVTTRTAMTEDVLTQGGALAFAPASEIEAFAAEAVRLARDARARSLQARAGRAMYERHFSWPTIAAGLTAAVSDTFPTTQ